MDISTVLGSIIAIVIICLPIIIVGMLIFLIFSFGKIKKASKAKSKIKDIQTKNFDKYDFDLNVDFKCEYCGNVINTKNRFCSHCGGTYNNNVEYKLKKEEKDKEYLEVLNKQEEELKKEIENIKKNKELLESNNSFILKRKFYNLDVDYAHTKFSSSENFEFACEYCGAKLKGKSSDDKTCTSCGASYTDNLELLIQEKKEQIELRNYQIYNLYQKQKEDINTQNYNKDKKDTERYINYSEKIANGIILFWKIIGILALMVIISNVIKAIIIK
jgi:hypothetical protein